MKNLKTNEHTHKKIMAKFLSKLTKVPEICAKHKFVILYVRNILNAYMHLRFSIRAYHWLTLPQFLTYSEVAYLDRLEEEDIFIIPVVLGGGIIWPSTPWVAPFFCGLGGTSGGSFLGEFPSSSSGFSGSGRRGVTLPSAYSSSWGRGVFLLT